jgi:urease accessory protein
VTGSVALDCALRGGRSCIARVRYDGLSRVSRARRDGDAVGVVLGHLGPGIIGGDRYALDVRVEPHASLVVTGQMATPVYARTGASSMHAHWRVDAGASLVVRAEPLMLDAGARHDAHATIDVAADASAIVADIVTVAPGALVRLRTNARIDGHLVARDACDLRAGAGAVATLIVVCADGGARAAMAALLDPIVASAPGVRGGVGTLPGALVVRATGARVWAAQRLVEACVTAVRARARQAAAA